MILWELNQSESNEVYQEMAITNGDRQFSFLQSAVVAALASQKVHMSEDILRALNYHAIVCLHPAAGEYRPCQVHVGTIQPPEHWRVPAIMSDFVNEVNRAWDGTDAITLASYVLWRLNFIHPFINGNGRTARAAAYFVICTKLNGWLPGSPILPARLKTERRQDYVEALRAVDASFNAGQLALQPLATLLSELLQKQIEEAATQQAG